MNRSSTHEIYILFTESHEILGNSTYVFHIFIEEHISWPISSYRIRPTAVQGLILGEKRVEVSLFFLQSLCREEARAYEPKEKNT
jgi:hypothetical protein